MSENSTSYYLLQVIEPEAGYMICITCWHYLQNVMSNNADSTCSCLITHYKLQAPATIIRQLQAPAAIIRQLQAPVGSFQMLPSSLYVHG